MHCQRYPPGAGWKFVKKNKKTSNFLLRAHADDDVVTKSAGWCGMRIQDERILSITDHKGMPFAVRLHTHSTPAAARGRKNKANNPESACAYRLRGAGGGLKDSPPALMRHLSVGLRDLSRLGMELGIPSSYAASVQHLRTTELHLESDGHAQVMGKTTTECTIAHIIESRHGLLAQLGGRGLTMPQQSGTCVLVHGAAGCWCTTSVAIGGCWPDILLS
jgi:hypothetical protein